MHLLTRWYIKSALVYLVTALLLAIVLALPSDLPSYLRFMNPAYFHLFLVGWVTQMILGVIYWRFLSSHVHDHEVMSDLAGPVTFS